MLLPLLVAAAAASSGGNSGGSRPPGGDGSSPTRASLGFLVDRLTLKRDNTWDDERTIGRLIELNRQLQVERALEAVCVRAGLSSESPDGLGGCYKCRHRMA